ncbi:MAG: hypothetical protein [Caudoviricetes sp.]|nr:MAG: hypothetical protein [Caudoviricetes sp.]
MVTCITTITPSGLPKSQFMNATNAEAIGSKPMRLSTWYLVIPHLQCRERGCVLRKLTAGARLPGSMCMCRGRLLLALPPPLVRVDQTSRR